MSLAHPDAMRSTRPEPTRTAPPFRPDYTTPRMRRYLLFDATGFLYLLVGFVVLRAIWALSSGSEAWAALLRDFQNPLYVIFHALCFVSVIFVGVRFFRLFPKAQPPRVGPLKPPPGPVIFALLYTVWIGVTIVFAAILAGVWP